MQRETLFILTHKFPYAKGEEYLWDEIPYLAETFRDIIICPLNCYQALQPSRNLPSNVRVQLLSESSYNPGIRGYLMIFRVLMSEWFAKPSASLFFSHLRHNLSVLKQNIKSARSLLSQVSEPGKTVVYSYWCDELATTAAFVASLNKNIKAVSRAHGFDVFDEQSDFNHIFFRKFQLKYLDALYSVSEKGKVYLQKKHESYSDKIHSEHLGIHSDGAVCFQPSDTIRLVTCSYIRSIKRLHLLPEILKQIPAGQKTEWYIIGDGPDLDTLKTLTATLPPHITGIYKGLLTTEEIHQLYRSVSFDYLVSLSTSEGLPVSMMEAISHGIPVLSTDVGGCNEIVVNQITGTLIESDFKPLTITAEIMAVKQSVFNTPEQRTQISRFWKSHYNAENNYRHFAQILSDSNR